MPDDPEELRICDHHPRVRKFIEDFGCRIAERADLMQAIRDEERRRKAAWTWIDRLLEEEAPRWINDQDTLVMEVSVANLAGEQCLNFTQQVSMFQPSQFEYMVWGGRGFVRMWWDPEQSPLRAIVRGYKRYAEGRDDRAPDRC
jgi:hypothetical protein